MIELKPLSEENITPFFTWLRDEEVIKYSLTSFQKLISEDEIKSWFSNLLSNTKDKGVRVHGDKGYWVLGNIIDRKSTRLNSSHRL